MLLMMMVLAAPMVPLAPPDLPAPERSSLLPQLPCPDSPSSVRFPSTCFLHAQPYPLRNRSSTCENIDITFRSQLRGLNSPSFELFQSVPSLQSSTSVDSIRLSSLDHTENFLNLLEQCIQEYNIELGHELHHFVVRNGLESDAFLASHLIRMFQSLNLLLKANQVFLKLEKPGVFAWSAIIFAYVKFGQIDQVLDLYKRMQISGLEPDGPVLVAVLKACALSEAAVEGQQIHACAIEYGLESDAFVNSSLINLYTKCGFLLQARMAFEKVGKQNLVAWNALITGYVQHGCEQDAFKLFFEMKNDGIDPDEVTFLCIVKACTKDMVSSDCGEYIHCCIVEKGFDSDPSISHSLIDMYAKCGCLQAAVVLFQKCREKNVIAWTALICGYAKHHFIHEVLKMFECMQEDGVEPNQVTFLSLINACSSGAAFEQGKDVHMHVIKNGYEADLSVGSALVDMYAKCGSLLDARGVFDQLLLKNSITWNAMIGGYVERGHGREALQLIQDMQQQGVEPDEVTFSCAVRACSNVEQCYRVHSLLTNGLELDVSVGNTLIDMYAKCGSLEDSKLIFSRLPEKDVVTWSTLIAGFVQHDCGEEALSHFEKMQQEGIEPNHVTFLCIVKACSIMSALGRSKLIQASIIKQGLGSNERIGSALVDMYSKCGSLEDAKVVFDRLPIQDEAVWSAMIGGYAYHNDYRGALKCFHRMQKSGIRPDEVTFLSLLSACGHGGMIHEGCSHFKSIREVYGLLPSLEHYDCLVDILGYGGELNVAEDLLETLPYRCNMIGWKSLLSSCKRHGNTTVGRRSFNYVVNGEPQNASGFRLMCGVYSSAGLWEEAEKLEQSRRSADAWKKPAKAFIEVDNQVHSFTVGDTSHLWTEKIYAKLKSLSMCMEEQGYTTPQCETPVSNDDKQDTLCGHAERLAIAFGLISTAQGTTIRVSKNFRVCNSCHEATRLISRLEKRPILIADTYCVHHFLDGSCSCRN